MKDLNKKNNNEKEYIKVKAKVNEERSKNKMKVT
jgi:hypothetical protein